MSNVVRFPGGRKSVVALIRREQLERMAEDAVDLADRLVQLLDDEDADADLETDADAEPSLGAPEGHDCQIVAFPGGDDDRELDQQQTR